MTLSQTELKTDLPYRVGRSKTGLGLFATAKIKKGTKIVRYFGPLLDSKKKDEDAVENKYLFQISKRWTIDGSVRENVARYINHSCKPNAESDVNLTKRKVTIRSIKRIEPGEEISYDYGTEYFKAYLKPIGCKCDACETKRAKKAEAVAKTGKAKKKAKTTKAAPAKALAPKTKAAAPKKPAALKKTGPLKKAAPAKARAAGKAAVVAKKTPASAPKAAAKTGTARGVTASKSVPVRNASRPAAKAKRPVAKAA